jgi:DNA polymerase III sliding clamp (beta) subunit (PCNA family)
MEINIKTSILSKTCSIIRELSSQRKDVENYVKVSCDRDFLAFSSADENIFATVRLPLQDFLSVDVVSAGTAFVSSDHFLKTVSSLKPANSQGFGCPKVHLLSDGKGMYLDYESVHRNGVTVKNSRALPQTQEEKFDLVTFEESDETITVSSEVMAKCLPKVLYATGVEDIDMQLNRINVEIKKPNQMCLTSTNGVKLSRISCPLKSEVKKEFEFIMPSRLSRRMLSFVSDTEEAGEVSFSPNGKSFYIKFHNKYLTIRCPKMRSKYPECSAFFDNEDSYCFLDRKVFSETVRNIMPVSDISDRRVTFIFSNNECSFSVKGAVGGQSSGLSVENLEVERKYDLNAQYVLDTMRNMSSDKIKVQFFKEDSRLGFYEDVEDVSMRAIVAALVRFS